MKYLPTLCIAVAIVAPALAAPRIVKHAPVPILTSCATNTPQDLRVIPVILPRGVGNSKPRTPSDFDLQVPSDLKDEMQTAQQKESYKVLEAAYQAALDAKQSYMEDAYKTVFAKQAARVIQITRMKKPVEDYLFEIKLKSEALSPTMAGAAALLETEAKSYQQMLISHDKQIDQVNKKRIEEIQALDNLLLAWQKRMVTKFVEYAEALVQGKEIEYNFVQDVPWTLNQPAGSLTRQQTV